MLRHLPPIADPAVLVGHATSDDAAVYRLSDDQALVATVDYFTPIVDDPYDFGRIAAANALSRRLRDGRAAALRPGDLRLPARPARLRRARARSCAAAPTRRPRPASPIVGGHSIDDAEPKYGLAVTGLVHPDRIVRNVGARAGRPAVPDQAARRRDRLDRGQARAWPTPALVARAVEVDGDAQPRRRRGDARGRAERRRPT